MEECNDRKVTLQEKSLILAECFFQGLQKTDRYSELLFSRCLGNLELDGHFPQVAEEVETGSIGSQEHRERGGSRLGRRTF